MEAFLTSEGLIALVTLSLMEIVLGIDNIVFITILTSKLPADERPRIRRIGLMMALATRILLLFALSWMMRLTQPLFALWNQSFSGRDLILLGGGLFLMFKATWEIYEKLEGDPDEHAEKGSAAARRKTLLILLQIALLDVVFSLDSVITAVGMANQISIMITAMVISMVVMLLGMNAVGGFVERHPSIKLLALSFLILIGVMLVAEGMGHHMPKGYIYFAMAFSLFVEMLNMRFRRKAPPVHLHEHRESPS
jgi:predicted tellurium resistance membrane protein TerC